MPTISRRQFLVLAGCAALLPFGCSSTNEPQVLRHTVTLERLPASFSGFTICHLSDLHSEEFGQGNSRLVDMIAGGNPDIIVMTGDMVKKNDPDENVFLTLCERLPSLAPTYYITGNHETYGLHDDLPAKVAERGIHFIDNRHTRIEREGESFCLAGAGEYYTYGSYGLHAAVTGIPEEDCTILLAHHPECMADYALKKVDLVLSGHTHGGQIRFPLVGGVFCPDQGLFPQYIDGMHHSGMTRMYISRGLGSSTVPMRINCPPELAFLTLKPLTV